MIKIVTLGDFDIIINGNSVLEELTSQKRLIRLLKYFLVHNGIKLLPENIIEDLWGNDDFKNPLNMLRTQISRLRKIINPEAHGIEAFFSIKFINNYYIFEFKEPCDVDFIKFEKKLEKDILSLNKDIEKDPLNFEKNLRLYKGSFLQEMGEEDWLVPIRSRFSRLYVKGMAYYIEYLKENNMYAEIASICEKGIRIEPYEEIINLNFMEALLNLEEETYALIHYEFFTKKLYNDLGEKPSRKLLELYKEIREREDKDFLDVDLNTVNSRLIEKLDFDRAKLCDIHYFKFLYTYEKIKCERNLGKKKSISIVTLESGNHRELTNKELKKGMDLLIYILFKTLWVGDVFTKWNKSQILILLYDLEERNIDALIRKIKNQFNSSKIIENLILNIKIAKV